MAKQHPSKIRSRLRHVLRRASDPLYELKRTCRRRAAQLWRSCFSKTVFIGVTGSHGKTTTTAILGKMLAEHAATMVGTGHNTDKAILQAVLRTSPWRHRYAVQEVSGDKPGAVDKAVRYLRPSVGIVTAIGGDHRKSFGGSIDAIAHEKGKLVKSLGLDGLAVLNADDPLVAAMGAECNCRVVTHGRADSADLRLLAASSIWPDRLTLNCEYRGKRFTVRSKLVGTHWASSILGALLTALELSVPLAQCLAVIEGFEPLYNRMSVHSAPNGASYVLDANKASFLGIEPCLEFLRDASAPRKTVIFGTLADYPGSSKSHYYAAARAALKRADRVIFTGPSATRVRRLATGDDAGRLLVVERPKEVIRLLGEDTMPGEIIYIKATRADRLARIFVPRQK